MKKQYLPVVLSFLILGALGYSQEVEKTTEPDYTQFKSLKELVESDQTDYFLVDVRTKGEYCAGHIPKAVNIPYDSIETIPVEDKDTLIILYCRSGHRASIAESALRELGYTNIVNFGGVGNWQADLEFCD